MNMRIPAAVIVASVLVAYALMTGGRPSAVRAAVMGCAVCAALLLHTQALPANTFALSWLVVLVAKPTDLFTAGFQLSFLCVAVLVWGIPTWFPPRERTPIEQLVADEESGSGKVVAADEGEADLGPAPGDEQSRLGDRLLAGIGGERVEDAVVARDRAADVVAARAKGACQAGDVFGEAAGSGERRRFGRGDQDAHAALVRSALPGGTTRLPRERSG